VRLSAVILLSFLALAGCAGPGHLPASEPVAPGVSLVLPAQQPFGNVAAVQLVEARRAGRTDRFEAYLEGGPERFTLAMTIPSGPSLMTVEWRPGRLVIRRGLAPEALAAERILADFMLVYAPEEALREALSGGDLVFSGGGARRIFRNGELLAEAVLPQGDPWEGEARLRNFVYDYELTIRSRNQAP
jgi:hypothetical protein